MRVYRSEIRLIQISVILAVIVLIVAIVARPVSEPPVVAPPDPGPSASLEGDNETPPEDELANTKIVCLGDSYTFGYPATNQDTSWPKYLGDALKVEVINAGKVHQNASDLVKRFDSDVAAHNPGRVIILAGIGDAIRNIPLETFQADIITLIKKAEANHIQPILALPFSFPDKKTLEFIAQYREWEKSYAQEKSILLLDFQSILFDDKGVMKSQYVAKEGYPNADGYKAMAEYAASILK